MLMNHRKCEKCWITTLIRFKEMIIFKCFIGFGIENIVYLCGRLYIIL